VVALDLPVALGGARRDPSVVDVVAGEQLAQATVVDVAPGVVGLQSLGVDALCGVERERAFNEGGDGRGFLVAVDLV